MESQEFSEARITRVKEAVASAALGGAGLPKVRIVTSFFSSTLGPSGVVVDARAAGAGRFEFEDCELVSGDCNRAAELAEGTGVEDGAGKLCAGTTAGLAGAGELEDLVAGAGFAAAVG